MPDLSDEPDFREEFTDAEVRQLRTLLQRAQDDPWAGQPILSGTFPRYQSYEALPTPGPEFGYTTIVIIGTPDVAHVCLREAGGAWGWRVAATG